MDQKTVRMELECARDCCKVDIRVHICLCLTTGVLIPTYSYYFLTQFGSFLFVRMKYYIELSSGCTIFVLLAMSNWKKKILCIWPSDKEEWERISNFLHSSSFRSRFGTVGLGHKQEWNSFVLATQSFWTCSNLSYSPADHTRMRRTLLECIGMDWNDHEWTHEPTLVVLILTVFWLF